MPRVKTLVSGTREAPNPAIIRVVSLTRVSLKKRICQRTGNGIFLVMKRAIQITLQIATGPDQAMLRQERSRMRSLRSQVRGRVATLT